MRSFPSLNNILRLHKLFILLAIKQSNTKILNFQDYFLNCEWKLADDIFSSKDDKQICWTFLDQLRHSQIFEGVDSCNVGKV